MCNCSPCKCPPSVAKGDPGIQGVPGPAPQFISTEVEILPADGTPELTISGVSPHLSMLLQLPQAPSPVFGTPVVNQLNPGAPNTVTINNANPLAPILTFGLAAGADGEDGVSPFTSLTAQFTQPAAGGTVVITVGDTSWISLGAWLYIAGGGHYVVASNPISATQVLVRNPGTSELSPYGWTATSIPTNAAAGATVANTGFDTQVQASGIPGTRGQNGAAGLTPVISVVYAIPSSPPASAELGFVYYSNAAPPAIPTLFIPYSWSGVSWVAGPNLAGQRGSTTFFQSADPNTSEPTGSQNGDVVVRQTGGTLQFYRRISASTWDLEVSYALAGTATVPITHDAPGTVALDLASFSYAITADKDLELDWDDANYNGQGEWTVVIRNIDGATIDLTYATGQWEENPAITLPATIATTAVVVLRFIQNPLSGLYTFTEAFTPAAV